MKAKTFGITAIFIGLLTLGFGQPNPPPPPPPPPALAISPTTFPNGQYGSAYKDQTMKATGGKAPYTFSVSGGELPLGLTLSTAGVLSGTPTAAAKYSFTVTVLDNSKPQKSGSRDYTLVIDPANLLVTANPQTKEFGAADPAFTFTASGLLFSDNTGIITGSLTRTPGENVGTYPISIGNLSAGANYTIGYTGNFLTITVASQEITWAQSLLIGCNSTSQVQLTATASSGLPVTYSVSDPNIATVSGNVLTLLHPGTAVVTATQAGDANHSAAPAVTDTLSFEPASLISQHWNDAIFFDNSSGDFVQWQWYKNGTAVPGATNPYYSESPSLNGQYFVIATNKDGQEVESCTLTITPGAAIPGGIKVSPNPVKTGAMVTVISNYSSSVLQGAVLQVLDITGKVRQQLTTVQLATRVTMPSQSGIYIINLLLSNGQKASINVLVVD
jgi:MBG domain (YGX type)/Putative Ig domain